ncbi:MAG: hypothetical protein KIS75_09320 [Chromatiales bacterium]|nr:hypothetical protein [Chromatiales bacterium]
MEKFTISKPMRLFFAVSGTIIWLGIWLTGFSVVHWLLYVPAVFFAIAVITGICPGLIVSKMLMRSE